MIGDSWHSYPKVYALGHRAITDLFLDPVVVQEKIDGSQFSFGVFNGELRARSRGHEIVLDAPENLFADAIDVIKRIHNYYCLRDGWTYRGEYLRVPKHNTLCYGRTPRDLIILFDININHESYLTVEEVQSEAHRIGLECVPTFGAGNIACVSEIRELLDRESVLGGTKIEGIVIKNYNRFGRDKHVLMGKYVSEKFKEKHAHDWKISNPQQGDIIENIIKTYRTEARWEKSVQHLREAGMLNNEPSDIGALIKEAQSDVLVECRDEISEALTKWALPKIQRGIVAGLPEWYKSKLAERQFS